MKEGWEYKRFDEIMSPAKVERCGNRIDLPVLSITMHGGIVEQNDRFKKTIASLDRTNYKIVKDGQLVIAFPIDEGLLYTQDVAPEGIMSPAYNIWDVDYSQIDRRFLVAYFHSTVAFAYIKAKLRGSTQRRRSMDKADLLSMPIPVPSLDNQQQIVSELDLLSGVIEKQKTQLEELDKLAQSIFYDMFGDPVTNEKGWKQEKLGHIFQTSSGGTPSKNNIDYYEGGSIPWLRSGEVSQGFIYKTELFITEAGMNNSSAKIFPVDTVAIAMYGATVGQVGIIKVPMTTNQAVCGLFPNPDYSPIFMMYFLKGMQPVYLKDAAGGAQPNISQGIIKNTYIPLIPLSLQQEFAAKVEAIEAMKAKVRQSLKEAETLFNERMDYYFN